MRVIVFIFTIALTAAVSQADDDLRSLTEQLDILANPDQPAAEREAAERVLKGSSDARLLRPLFHMRNALMNDWQMFPLIPLPDRLWQQFSQNAQPEEQRKRIFLELFDEWEKERDLQLLFEAATWNCSPELEKTLWRLFADRDHGTSIRVSSASTLSRIAHLRSSESFRHYRQRTLVYLWKERGSDVAIELGGHFGGPWLQHPYLDVMKLDWYERERSPETRRSGTPMKALLEDIDSYFGNVSGMYQSRNKRMDRAVSIVQQRNELRDEARETGDESKLREFEAELAAQQESELERRIERIDTWIARNRNRLERQAEAYHRERMREEQDGD